MATLFYEPSTRTRLSFESAMYKLGGNVISTENAAQFSSAVKGESLEDTIRVVSSYADCIVLRHPDKGAAKFAAEYSNVPVINAGDGSGEHPTQALLDLYTVQKEVGSIDGKHFCLVGDLLNGRTIHSLVYLLSLYENIHFDFISPKELSLPESVLKFITEKKIATNFFESLKEYRENPLVQYYQPDVIYMTRLQKERILNTAMEINYDSCTLTKEDMDWLTEGCIIMHPLPRREEVPVGIDADPRAAYFRQAANGLWVRAGLIHWLLNASSNLCSC
jgi:aspartate carbamoyltransferase catalytic subunit